MLESKYWAKDNEKKILNKALMENEKKYQEYLREKFNPDHIFRKEEVEVEKVENFVAIVEYKDSIWTKIKKWVKRIF